MFIGGIYDKSKSKKQINIDLNKIKKINCFSAIKYNISRFSTKGFGVISIVPERLFKKIKLKKFKDIVITYQGYILEETIDSLYKKYKEKGNEFVKELDGNFNIILFNKKNKVLRIFNDRSAYFGMYYSTNNNLTFGTNIKSNLMFNKTPEINKNTIIELFHLGHFLGDNTLFRSVKHLNQGSILKYKNNLTINQYWIPRFNPIKKNKKWFIKEFNRLLRKAVSKRIKEEIDAGLALSGGLDSRAVAAAIEKENLKIKAFSYGEKTTNDFRFGKSIAKKLGFEHFELEIKNLDLMELIPFITWQIEGNVSYEGCLSPVYHEQLIENKIKYKFGGAAGDICSGGHIQPYMIITKNKRNFIKKSLKRKEYISHKDQKRIFNKVFFKKKFPKYKKKLLYSFIKTKEKNIPNLNDVWDFQNRQQRFVFSSNQVDKNSFINIAPFLDKELLDLWLKTPIKYRLFQNFYKKAILRLNKKIKNVPWAHTGKKIPSNIISDISSQGINCISNKIKNLFSKFYFNKKSEMIDMRKLISNNLKYKKELINFTNSNYFPEDIFDKKGTLKLIKEHYSDEKDNSKSLNMLMTINYSLKYMNNQNKIPKEVNNFLREVIIE